MITQTIFRHYLKHIYLLAVVLIVSGTWGCNSDDEPKEDVRTELLEKINALRQNGCQCGNDVMAPVPPLKWNTALEEAALYHAIDMYVHHYFSHLSFDGTPHIIRVQEAGYEGDYVGEVIARKYYSTTDVINGWKGSESHCKALMDSLYNDMGGGRKVDYWVVDLGQSK